MNDATLRQLARQAGLAVDWIDYRGVARSVTPETLRAVLAALEPGDKPPSMPPEPEPLRAFGVNDAAPGRRLWGLGLQLYALRRDGDDGLGDYTALAQAAVAAARQGASAIALSPTHASFFADPSRYSPYAPSNRLFFNAWHVDPGAPGLDEAAELIDWGASTSRRAIRLRARFESCAPSLLAPDARGPQAEEFRAFRAGGGAALEDHARFEALHAHQRGDWREWPQELREPRSAAVEAFAREHAREVDFHVFLQWQADRQLGVAQAAAREAGMPTGLISDLAVGVDPAGSEAWSDPGALLRGLAIGAPPDELNPHGQDWGLTTFSPRALIERNGAPLRDVLRAALRHAGGVRIDHVLGLNRLWLVPRGARATEGVYLRYPLAQLLKICAEESWTHRALIVGEDLGTVPVALRDTLAVSGVLGLEVLWFARDHGLFREPPRWRDSAIATTSTHDVPTVAGWWSERDLDWRAQLSLFAAGRTEAEERAQRARERQALWDAFIHARVVEEGAAADPAGVVDAAARYVARTPSPLAILPIEDLAGLVEQPNLPGTVETHPNWRRRLPASVAELLARPDAARRLALLRSERP